jgi:hypothetical protein
MVDFHDQFAWMPVVVALAWGGEPRKMQQALATLASEGLGILHELNKLPFAVPDIQTLSRAIGLPAEELARMPGATTLYQNYYINPARLARELMDKVFTPAGHFRTVAAAPGWDRLLTEMQHTAERGAQRAGVLLLIVATLAECHPEFPASLNRAIAVVEAGSARDVWKVPSGRTLIEIWTRWKQLAPLWAACTLEIYRGLSHGLSPNVAELEAAYDPTRLKRILGTAKWFQSFAESHRSERARGPLLQPGEALQIVADVDEIRPNLEPLSAEDLMAASAYHAPGRKDR